MCVLCWPNHLATTTFTATGAQSSNMWPRDHSIHGLYLPRTQYHQKKMIHIDAHRCCVQVAVTLPYSCADGARTYTIRCSFPFNQRLIFISVRVHGSLIFSHRSILMPVGSRRLPKSATIFNFLRAAPCEPRVILSICTNPPHRDASTCRCTSAPGMLCVSAWRF